VQEQVQVQVQVKVEASGKRHESLRVSVSKTAIASWPMLAGCYMGLLARGRMKAWRHVGLLARGRMKAWRRKRRLTIKVKLATVGFHTSAIVCPPVLLSVIVRCFEVMVSIATINLSAYLPHDGMHHTAWVPRYGPHVMRRTSCATRHTSQHVRCSTARQS
jgi:hypothetical protein